MGEAAARTDGPEWAAQAERVARVCATWITDLVGVYVHGSAVLGGFGPGSDLDVLVVAEGEADWPGLGSQLLAEGGHPRPLELSVVAASAALHPAPPWPYHLHVNSGELRFGLGAGRGDPDLIAHYVVTRAAGVAVIGPPPDAAFGPVSRKHLVDYLREELRWGVENADQRYAVLNTCRSVAYARSGRVLSKVDGGTWWVAEIGDEPLVEEAIAAQRDGRDLGPATPEARDFVVKGREFL
jgi:streptomycin 3"-adenylyltransferase